MLVYKIDLKPKKIFSQTRFVLLSATRQIEKKTRFQNHTNTLNIRKNWNKCEIYNLKISFPSSEPEMTRCLPDASRKSLPPLGRLQPLPFHFLPRTHFYTTRHELGTYINKCSLYSRRSIRSWARSHQLAGSGTRVGPWKIAASSWTRYHIGSCPAKNDGHPRLDPCFRIPFKDT